MRLDRFLWWARIAKTRGIAQTIAADGRVRLDGRIVDRAHAAVRPGNVLTFAAHGRIRVIRILALPLRRGPAPEAQVCYAELVPGPATPDAAPALCPTPSPNQDKVLVGGAGETAGAARLGNAEPPRMRTSRSKPRSIDDADVGA